jgi:hypothetical protein
MNPYVRHKPDEAHRNIVTWKTEIAFMKDEVSFFQDLLDKHFVAMSAGEQMGNLAGLIMELNTLSSNDLKWLTERLNMLDTAVSNQTEWQDAYSKDRYAECGKRMHDLSNQFKTLKSRIFQVVGSVIKKD